MNPNTQKVKMTSAEMDKLYKARTQLIKEMFMAFGFLIIGCIGVLIFNPEKLSIMIGGFSIAFVIYAIIGGFIFLPKFQKIGGDIRSGLKMRVKVRVRNFGDRTGESDVIILLEPNKYGIKKIIAPSSYSTIDMINAQMDISVAVESHVLLSINSVIY